MTSTTVSIRLEGHAAIDFAKAHGLMLQKYTDPTEQAREELSVEEAREIAQEDPSLVYVDIAPDIRVLGLGDEDWTAEGDGEEREGAAEARQWERYGTVRVQIGDVTYQVGVAIGVPASLRATAEAAGGDTTRPAYLDAWYVDASDWSCAPASHGPEGVPRELADAVLEAIYDARVRLWREYEEERADAAEGE